MTDQNNKVDVTDFIKRIVELGYFKYTNADELLILKNEIRTSYDPNGELSTVWDEYKGISKDLRSYYCDGENVFEQGGITDMLKMISPFFDKINFKCEISDHFEEYDDTNKWLNHRITINGTEYMIFKDFKGVGWGEAPMRLAEILNEELEKQGKDEKIYLISGANDGKLIFLTKELYDYIYSIYKNPLWKPLEINEWCKVMQVTPMDLT